MRFLTNYIKSVFINVVFICQLCNVSSVDAEPLNVGYVSNNLSGFMELAIKFINAGCFAGGVIFAMLSVLRYKAHRQNPSQVRLHEPFFLLIVGIALMILPLLSHIMGFSLFGPAEKSGAPNSPLPNIFN